MNMKIRSRPSTPAESAKALAEFNGVRRAAALRRGEKLRKTNEARPWLCGRIA